MSFGAGPTVGALAMRYVVSRRKRGEIVALTATNQVCILSHFVSVVGDRPVERLTRRLVDRWFETLEPFAYATRRTRVSTVRAFCGWLLREGYVNDDLLANVPKLREPRHSPRGVRQDAARKLILVGCPDSRARLVVVLMLQLGLRCGEVHNLQLGDIDLFERSVRVVGKGRHERYVRLTEEALRALNDYLAEHPANYGPLVRSYRKPTEPLTADTISGLVAQWMYAAGIKRGPRDGVTGHALRHQCAGDLLRGGAKERDVQRVLGHAHLTTTERYLPTIVDPLEDVMEGRWYGLAEA